MARSAPLAGAAVIVGSALALASCGFGATGPADLVTDHGARLEGEVGSLVTGPTSYRFEYGTTAAYGSSTPVATVAVTDVHTTVGRFATVEGLAEGTEYHYRLCVADAGGHGSCGADETFTTSAGHDFVYGDGVVATLPGIHPVVVGGRVDAGAASDGSSPTGRVDSTPPLASPTAPFQDSGPVTCLRVEGNRATVGFVAEPFVAGEPAVPMLAFVEDGAATATADRWAVKALGAPATTCPAPNEADFPARVIGGLTVPRTLQAGDLVVHDHPTPP